MLHELLNLKRPLLVFDLETTSSDPEVARICQFAFMLFKPSGEVSSYATLVDPLVEIPKAASAVHGITDEIIKFGCAKCRRPLNEHVELRDSDIAPTIIDHEFKPVPQFRHLGPRIATGFAGCDLSGYNVQFDIDVMERHLLRECNLLLDLDGVAIIDPNGLWRVQEPRNLSAAYEKFTGKKAENAHDALADVRMTVESLIGQLQLWTTVPREVDKLHLHIWPDRIDYSGKFVFDQYGEPCFGFGKHRGKPMRMHVDYLRWMSRQGNWSSPVTRIVKEALEGRFPEKRHESPRVEAEG